MIGNFSVPQTRKGGRKIETWTHHFPDDEKAEIEVFLVSSGETSAFEARSTHPLLKNFKWQHTDISQLADLVKSDIQEAVNTHSGDRWQPAMVLEVNPQIEDKTRRKVASVSITTFPVTLDTLTPPANDGTRRVLRDGVSGSIQERSINDEAHAQLGSSRIRMESSSTRRVLLTSAEIEEQTGALQSTLETFGRILGMRLSPDNPNPDDIPTPQDLVEMMQKAVDGAAP